MVEDLGRPPPTGRYVTAGGLPFPGVDAEACVSRLISPLDIVHFPLTGRRLHSHFRSVCDALATAPRLVRLTLAA